MHVVKPQLVVALGATAAQTILGCEIPLNAASRRGHPIGIGRTRYGDAASFGDLADAN